MVKNKIKQREHESNSDYEERLFKAEKKEYETEFDYEKRLYQNKSLYDLSYVDLRDILEPTYHPDTVRKTSVGFLKACKLMSKVKFNKQVMLLNDIHLPFERSDVLEIIAKHATEITHLIIGGDLLDCKSISFFSHDNEWSLIEEWKYGYSWLQKVRKILGDNIPIILFNGNHEERFEKIVQKDSVLQNFIDPKLLRMYQDGTTLYVGNKKTKYAPIKNLQFVDSWYINIDNKIIYSHPKDFSAVDGKMTEKIAEFFLNKGEIADVYVFGHTHKYCQQTVARRQGVYVVENGCLCHAHDYANSGKLSFTPQHYCYTIIKYNKNEPINFNNIQVYHLENNDKFEESKVDL